MKGSVYERRAEGLDRLPNGFPRTPSNVEIPLLKRIFSSEEDLVGELCSHMEAVDVIAERVELPAEEVRGRLIKLARRGACVVREAGRGPKVQAGAVHRGDLGDPAREHGPQAC